MARAGRPTKRKADRLTWTSYLRLTEEHGRQLEKLAADDDRDVAVYVRRLVQKHLREVKR